MSLDAVMRSQQIRQQVEAVGQVKIAELAATFGVSEMTVRRDLDALADQGVVSRVRGGAVSYGPRPFGERVTEHGNAKERIAAKLLTMVDANGALGLDASSTMQRFAAKLVTRRELTVVTNGLESFLALRSAPGVAALLTGGQLDSRTGSLVGPLACRSVRDLALGQVFVSAAGIEPGAGTTETTLEDAETKLAFAEVASQVVLAVDSSKLGRRVTSRCLSLDRVDALVTELDPGDHRLDPYRDAVTLV